MQVALVEPVEYGDLGVEELERVCGLVGLGIVPAGFGI